jgi:thioredoxin-like negative regulator of GroEL
MKASQHGSYNQIQDEKSVLKITTETRHCVVHFCHKEFRRCVIMHSHLEKLAKTYFTTRFIHVDVEDCPFLVTRLQVQVLPCVIFFIEGVSKDRYVVFSM